MPEFQALKRFLKFIFHRLKNKSSKYQVLILETKLSFKFQRLCTYWAIIWDDHYDQIATINAIWNFLVNKIITELWLKWIAGLIPAKHSAEPMLLSFLNRSLDLYSYYFTNQSASHSWIGYQHRFHSAFGNDSFH